MLSRVLRPSTAVRRAVQYQVVRGFAEPVGTRPIPKVPGSEKSAYEHGKFRSNAQELINKVPVIEVADTVAVCDGGSGALGHPLEYIQLNTVSNEPQNCKYCGLRYKMKEGGHHH
eukprot:gene2217-1621_t